MESTLNIIEITNHPEIDQKFAIEFILEWVYSGECEIPSNIFSIILLLNLADEYMLGDLQSVCEDEVIFALNSENVV